MTFGLCRARFAGSLLVLPFYLLACLPAMASSVTLKTVLGEVVIELYDEETPETVANFLNYVRDGDYDSSFVHRNADDL